MRKIKVGMIGLGEVAQVIHLPILQNMEERFELVAVCDVSPGLVAAIGERYRVTRRYSDAEELIADPEVEAVFVLNSDEYHADCIVAAAKRGKHVFVEKPMCLNIGDAERVIATRNESGVQVMVGYMRRYAPAFAQAAREIRSLGRINYARVRDIIGPNSYFTGQSSNVLRFSDMPRALDEDRQRRGRTQVEQALGKLAEPFYHTYRFMGGLSSHDLSAMRELLGMPSGILAAARWNGGQFMSAIFQYDGFHVLYETGVDRQGRFDASIEVFGEEKSVSINYDTPYIRHLPITVTVTETEGDAYKETVLRPTYTDPYTVELQQFYDAVAHGGTVKTTPEDFEDDLRLFRILVEAMARAEGL
ncbi:putative dehydrogenase [Paenibacillus endophyticus]|uniref:Putative dehydrogenase n=1 Tax=Paenibacillus endophyticus TaxID=1294268 RepID=A0A7W5C4A6_9BACL|nr:Gfo/Idh/MocA family oxidoreductase [Paenibacillus endophyticus]MBB3150389.1 putative dehydrogenase [Paenibacillus endophyticus]